MASDHRWNDFLVFTEGAIRTNDIDPAYPILKWLVRNEDEESALWLVLLYLAYYNLPSAVATWQATSHRPQDIPEFAYSFPKATERRAHRDLNQLRRHLDSIVETATVDWWKSGWALEKQGERRWTALFDRAQEVHGNGRWAAYKMGDLAHYVLGWNTPAATLGIAHSSGPRHGLNLLLGQGVKPKEGNTPYVVGWYESYGNFFLTRLKTRLGREITLDRLETALCDFHSLTQGRYYVGHDIDQMHEQIERFIEKDEVWGEEAAHFIYEARVKTLDNRHLGEIRGWAGVSKPLCSEYKLHRRILTRNEWEAQR